ncbi:hypothetical protein BJ165DRAFT_650316 [Panaeolus papilionaceus]|nr:hypothetical protein BJ165DRAFT_650316 [Panaeolus papilionaceus]
MAPLDQDVSYLLLDLRNTGDDAAGNSGRSLWSIIWACLLTFFACTWVAIHPNVPREGDSSKIILARRIGFMLCMLIIPEMVICWALRQWLLATYYAKKFEYNDSGIRWTRMHAFFLIMGGFSYFSEKGTLETLAANKLTDLYDDGVIEWPTVTIEQIQDHSKADFLSKFLVLIQTTWFSLQLIVRLATGMSTTELEISTFAYSVLTLIVYVLWWDKPFDVRSHIVVPGVYSPMPRFTNTVVGIPKTDGTSVILSMELETFLYSQNDLSAADSFALLQRALDSYRSINKGHPSVIPNTPHAGQTPPISPFQDWDSQWESEYVLLSITKPMSTTRGFWEELREVCNATNRRKDRGITLKLNFWRISTWFHFVLEAMRAVTRVLSSVFGDPFIHSHVEYGGDGDIPEDTRSEELLTRYPWCGRLFRGNSQAIVIALVGSIFGAIHLVAWSFHFPTLTEMWLWRACSLALTLLLLMLQLELASLTIVRHPRLLLIYSVLSFSMVSSYPIARFTMIVLPLISLRDPAPGVFVDIAWTSLIPHF